MDKLVIEGGRRLDGELSVGGSKNAVLPILAALLLADEPVTLKNVPNLTDVMSMIAILREMGAQIEYNSGELYCNASQASGEVIPTKYVREIRSSVVFLGSAIARNLRAWITYPGGCEIGQRPINIHIEALKQLGIDIVYDGEGLQCTSSGLKGADIYLSFPSVGATENVMLAAARAKGKTVIRNAAREPEIKALQDFINSMGGEISGAGSDVITVIGKKRYHATEFAVIPDRIVAGTYIAAAAATGSDMYIKNVPTHDMMAVLYKFMEMGVEIISDNNGVRVLSPKRLRAVNHTHTMPYPGFPTDMQAQLTSLLTIAQGYSVVRENIFDNRFRFVGSLTDMGADIFVENNKTAYICGVDKLHGATVQGTDLRGTAALIIAALSAEGTTVIEKAGYINRGYEDIAVALQSAGAKVIWM